MNITVLQENLLPAVQDAMKFVSNKPQLPILSGIVIQAAEGNVLIQSTDIKVGFTTLLGGKIKEEGQCVLSGRVLLEFLNTLTAGPIEIQTDGMSVNMSQRAVQVKLESFPYSDFPPFPKPTGRGISLSVQEFTSLVDGISYAASLDETRPVLTSMQWRIENSVITAASTDGYRLAVNQITLPQERPSQTFLIPSKTAQEVVHILSRAKEKELQFEVSKELAQVFFHFGKTTILVRLIEGEFPEYERIIPPSFSVECIVDKEAWMGAIKTALVFAKESSSIISFQFKDSYCYVRSASQSIGQQEGKLELLSDPMEEEKTISFNGKFFLDALSHLPSEHVRFFMNEELKPAMLKTEKNEYPLNIIMPFKH